MNTESITLPTSLPSSLEIMEISLLTGMSQDEAIGKLFRALCWFRINGVDGRVESISKRIIKEGLDGILGYEGFCEILIQVGWMVEGDDDSISVVDDEI